MIQLITQSMTLLRITEISEFLRLLDLMDYTSETAVNGQFVIKLSYNVDMLLHPVGTTQRDIN